MVALFNTLFCCLCWTNWKMYYEKPIRRVIKKFKPKIITPEPEPEVIEEEEEVVFEKEPTIKYLYDVEDADSMIEMRAKVIEIMRPFANGELPRMTGVRFNKS